MKKNIHPDYHEIEVQLLDGSSFKTKSTWGKKGGVLRLERDVNNHPAWQGDNAAYINEAKGSVAMFNKRFSGVKFSSLGKKKKS